MKGLHSRLKLGLTLLICSGAIACTCAAYGVGIEDILRTLMRAAGFKAVQRGGPAYKETIVSAGSELSVDRGAVTVRKVPPGDMAQRLAWAGIHQTDGWIAFQGETLESVVAAFNLHNGRQLVIGDAATGRLRVGGKFRVTDLDGFVAALEVTHGVNAIISPADGKKREVIVLSGGASGSAYSDEFPQLPEDE